jgi:hypothetical protein
MSVERANRRLPDIFWQAWRDYWKDQPEEEVQLVFIKPFLDGDFLCVAPINGTSLHAVMEHFNDHSQFEVLHYGEMSFALEGFYRLWSAFVVTARQHLWDVLVVSGITNLTNQEPDGGDVSVLHI